VQAVEGEKVVEYISADKVGLGDGQVAFDVHPLIGTPELVRGIVVFLLQDLPGQHQAGGLAADLASSDATPADLC